MSDRGEARRPTAAKKPKKLGTRDRRHLDGAASLSARTPGRADPPRREDRGRSRTMGGAYDEVDLEDMEWNAELGAFTYQCPCGDLFQITPDELRAGEEIGHCPSCSLVITVVYDDEDLKDLIPEGF